MPQAQGTRGIIKIQKEAAFKTDPVTPAMVAIPFESESLKMSSQNNDSAVIVSGRNPTKSSPGNTEVGGDIVTELGATLGRLFEGVLGSVNVTGAGPYVHAYTIGNTLPSWVVEKGFQDINQYFKYNGVMFNRMSFDITASGFQKVTFGMLGAKETVSNTSFHAGAVVNPKASFDGFSIATVEEGGVAIADVVAITGFTIENAIDGDTYLIGGLGERAALNPGVVKVTGTLKAIFKDVALYNKAKNRTESSLKVVYKLFGAGSGAPGDGAALNEKLEIFVPELTYAPNAPVISGPKGVFVELPFTGYYENAAGASALQMTITGPLSGTVM